MIATLARLASSDAARPCLFVFALFALMAIAEQACSLMGAGLIPGVRP